MSTWGGPRNSLDQPVRRQRHDPDGHLVVQRHDAWPGHSSPPATAESACRSWRRPRPTSRAPPGSGSSASWARRATCPGHPETTESQSFARQCRGACRGRGGTPHSKYFLFDNVGSSHQRNIVVQTSMNLTTFAFQGQWNQAQAMRSLPVYDHFLADLQAGPGRTPGRRRLPPLHLRQRDRHVLPQAGHQCRDRPGHADAQPDALPGGCHRLGSDQDPDHPVRHLRHARRLARQEVAPPVELRL